MNGKDKRNGLSEEVSFQLVLEILKSVRWILTVWVCDSCGWGGICKPNTVRILTPLRCHSHESSDSGLGLRWSVGLQVLGWRTHVTVIWSLQKLSGANF